MKNIIKIFVLVLMLGLSHRIARSNDTINKNHFIMNEGQYPDEVLFYSSNDNGTVWITKEGIVYDYYNSNIDLGTLSGSIISQKFLNVNFKYRIVCKGKKSNVNILKGHENIMTVATDTVLIEDYYPSIDIKFFYDKNMFRYDFICGIHASYSDIKFEFKGQESLDFTLNQIVFNDGVIKIDKLKAYQEIGKEIVLLETRYIREDGIFSIEIDEVNSNFSYVIDPIVYSTYLGERKTEDAKKVHVFESGNTLVCGNTISRDFPTTLGSYQEKFSENINSSANYDICLTLFNPTLSDLVYSTFIGGGFSDFVNNMRVDESENIYLLGNTKSPNFPIVGEAFSKEILGDQDAFLIKMKNDGKTLEYSSYLGGNNIDDALDFDFLSDRKVVIVGETYSNNLKTNEKSYDRKLDSLKDAFVCVLELDSPSNTNYTYLGGKREDWATAVVVTETNEIIVGGNTVSNNYPTTRGVYKETYTGGKVTNFFITKITSDLDELIFSTYLGGRYIDDLVDMAIDDKEVIYLLGNTNSDAFPVTAGVIKEEYYNFEQSHIVVTKLSGDGKEIIASTFFGTRNNDFPNSMKLDENNSIHISGYTGWWSDFILVNNDSIPYHTGDNGFYAIFSNDLTSIQYSIMLGQGGITRVADFNFSNEVITLFGNTTSSLFPVTNDAFQRDYKGSSELFITQIKKINYHQSQNEMKELDYSVIIIEFK